MFCQIIQDSTPRSLYIRWATATRLFDPGIRCSQERAPIMDPGGSSSEGWRAESNRTAGLTAAERLHKLLKACRLGLGAILRWGLAVDSRLVGHGPLWQVLRAVLELCLGRSCWRWGCRHITPGPWLASHGGGAWPTLFGLPVGRRRRGLRGV